MVTEFQGSREAENLRVGVIASRFNEFITARLLSGALEALRACGIPDKDIVVAWVPGALELPQAASRMAKGGGWDALVALGCVIRGETYHFNVVADCAAQGINAVARETGVPIAFGVLTVDNAEQAVARAGGALGNRGADTAEAAVQMANLFRELPPLP
ncbi:MAG: 6,7-dimethyl-8-ribityllumazine synthase [Chloroflexota bacterium]|nr:6,7-dimethyl-8-ribityllumazine synthase [Chloroflexota bacterium]